MWNQPYARGSSHAKVESYSSYRHWCSLVFPRLAVVLDAAARLAVVRSVEPEDQDGALDRHPVGD